MLCELAHSFPPFVAQLLERDRTLKRNFREETVTDLLMASLVGLSAYGISVEFPDEQVTGGDMEWHFAAPNESNGGRYLRLILQAKRAQFKKLKTAGYWLYKHLDHGTRLGDQAQTLVSYARRPPDGRRALPLYILYHPRSALNNADKKLPAIEGINLIPADRVAPVVLGGCSTSRKRISFWRAHFLPLSEFLCWPDLVPAKRGNTPEDAVDGAQASVEIGRERSVGFHPDLVAMRLQKRIAGLPKPSTKQDEFKAETFVENNIPPEIHRAILGHSSSEDRKALTRPRVIFSTPVKHEDTAYERAEAFLRSRDQ